ncbi:transposase [Streptomyces niveus]|uniref:transposase n=1 Tax=Streptomyces niveus TaxID=193462 RepID=UPI00379EE901
MPKTRREYTDAQKGQILRDFIASGKSQSAYARDNKNVDAARLSEWARDAERYGVDAETLKKFKGRIRVPKNEIKKIIDEWVADPLERSVTDFALARAEPIAPRTMLDWLKNSARFGVSQKTVDATKVERKGRVAPAVQLTDEEKRNHILAFMNQKDPVAEYARRQHLGHSTFHYWLREAESFGLSQDLVDLAVQNRTEAYAHGSRQTDRLLLHPDGPPPLDAPEPAGAYGYSGTAVAGPSHQDEEVWRQDLDFSGGRGIPPQEYSPEDTFAYPSNTTVSSYMLPSGFSQPQAYEASWDQPSGGQGIPPQEYSPEDAFAYSSNTAVSSYMLPSGFSGTQAYEASWDQSAQAGGYAQFMQAAAPGQLSASHFPLPDARASQQYEPPRVSRHDAATDATKKGESSRHRH